MCMSNRIASENNLKYSGRKKTVEDIGKDITALNKIFDLNPNIISIYNADGHFVKGNQAFIDLFQSSKLPPDYSIFTDPIMAMNGYSESLKRTKKGEIVEISGLWFNPRIICPDLTDSSILISGIIFPITDNDNNLEYIVSMYENITNLHKAEVAFKESIEYYRTFFNNIPIPIWEIDISDALKVKNGIEGNNIQDYDKYYTENPNALMKILSSLSIVDVNGEALKLYAAKTKEELFTQFIEHLIPESFDVFHDIVTNFREGKRQFEYETVNQTLDGKLINIILRLTFPLDTQLSKKVLVTVTDITKRKKTEKALQESEERFRLIAELSPFPIAFIDSDDRYLYINKKFTEVFGYTLKDIPTGREWFSLAFPDPAYRKNVIATWKSDKENISKGKVRTRTFIVKCKDGTVREITFRPTTTEDNKQYITYEDITERKRMEEERLKAGKLDSLGILAGGIAHDFNNILSAILGNISLAKKLVTHNDNLMWRLTNTESACYRAKDLTQQLLTFSRGGTPVKETVSISEIIKESANISLTGSNVRCDFFFKEDLMPVHVDKGQISQVINNLIINAYQAMPDGGVIKIIVENCIIGEKNALAVESGKYVKISIEDQGIGIPEDLHTKIFDPYFTTKQKGVGLGLTTAYSIIKRHGGYIFVDSKTGTGTTFTIYLPAFLGSPDTPVKNAKEHITSQRTRGKILVMDDEKEICTIMTDMLVFIGYEAESAYDGAEAIEIYKKAMDTGEPFDAVIMDLTVPGGMGGKAAMKVFLEIDPNINAIVSSGYSNDPVLSHYKEYGFRGCISKPFSLNELKKTVGNVITAGHV